MSSGNCYSSGPIPHLPDSTTPSLYPKVLQGTPEPLAVVLPGSAIRQIVGECYGPDIGLTPDGTAPGLYPRETLGVPEVVPEVEPGEVIRQIVQRCYPGLPDIEPPEEEIPDWNDVISTDWDFGWLCELFPDLPVCSINSPTILPPFPWNPVGPFINNGEGTGSDCERIMEGLAQRPPTVRKHEDPRETDKYVVINTGEYLYCNIDPHPKNPDWEQCVKDSLDCIFKPYVTGTWKTPAADCDTTYFRGQNSTSNQICVKNCLPERAAVYEYTNGNNTDYGTDPTAPAGYTRVSSEPAFYMLKYKQENSIPLFRFYSSNRQDTFLTTNPGLPDSPGAGERATMNAGNYSQGSIFGYVFADAGAGVAYLAEDEEMVPLHRYYKGTGSAADDHMYSLQLQATAKPPTYNKKRQIYRIPSNVQSGFTVGYKVKKGGAAYKNSWGWYISTKDGSQIVANKVIKGNIKQNIDYAEITISKSTLAQYPGHNFGFFIVPDGDNYGINNGDTLSFSGGVGGYTVSSGSAQSGYAFFSDYKMNPGQRNKTRLVGDNWQWWEDLLNGDDDYDDVKIRYEISATGNGYTYEGIQCYLYANAAPAKVFMPITPKDPCSTNKFDTTFQPSVVTRTNCGGYNTHTDGTEGQNNDSGICQGGYAAEVNRTQSIKAYKSTTYQLKAYGLITSTVEAGDLRVHIIMKRNGTNVVDFTTEVNTWPEVGNNIGSPFSISEGDTLSLTIDEIESGPQSATATLTMILHNVTENSFEVPFSATIGTTVDDDLVSGRTEVISDNAAGGGSIKKLSIQIWDNDEKDWSEKVYVWDNGQLNTNNANGQLATWNNTYYSGGYYEGFTQRNGHILSATIDEDGAVSTPTDGRGIFFNQLFDHGRGLICKPSNPLGGLLIDYEHHSIGAGFTSWFLNELTNGNANHILTIEDYYARGIKGLGSGGQYSKMSFMHDYVLGVFGNEQKQTAITPTGKVRVAFWPYAVSIDDPADHDRWGCAIELFDVIDGGNSYVEGDSFVLEWPTKQPTKGSYQDLGTSTTPYWPRDDENFSFPNELELKRRGGSDSETYVPRYAFYQESHNRDSNIWYVSHYKMKPVRFRVTIEEVN
ncbi:hypothetical protein SSZBM1_92 [Synechococcus phage S-SZBM1]|uniref:Uncharacterized protein n=1 Tax=Synechococcus phage S-SZBM1 TaxID=2926475 RepID=A0AC61TSK1_9CAUD|nr:hypothetical protein PP650_gp184 [Synechococcus phage S-SZBM1]UNH61209.1 hypothetical protein SSZBM1_92 [Synechococcus phage S-SZBM1]